MNIHKMSKSKMFVSHNWDLPFAGQSLTINKLLLDDKKIDAFDIWIDDKHCQYFIARDVALDFVKRNNSWIEMKGKKVGVILASIFKTSELEFSEQYSPMLF